MDELRQYKERLRIALIAAKICIFEVDLVHQLYTFFENAEATFGISNDTILKDVQPYSQLEPEEYRMAVSRYFSHPDDEEVIEKAFINILNGNSAIYEARMKAGNSRFKWCSIHVTPVMENGRPARMIGVITDISDIKEKTERLEMAVNLDSFTGLYNKKYAISLIDDVLEKERQLKHALIVIDIDNFKKFNDTYGHHEGDKILKEISCQIRAIFRKQDIVARFGGDEFIVLAQDIKDGQWLFHKLSKLIHIRIDNLVCTNSIGVSFFPREGTDFNELFKKADEALYQAKIEKEKIVFSSMSADIE